MATRSLPFEIRPDSDTFDELRLTDEVVGVYGLDAWAAGFSLMTAGYRDHIDPDDAASPNAPFNAVTVAIMAEARGRVFRRKVTGAGHLHVGGEVRAHTQTFIQVAARVYAAQGYTVHLRRDVSTSPIWYSSFAVFHEEYAGGDNFTASHSPYFKLGWKVLDQDGKELLEEEPDLIAEVQSLVRERTTITLAPWRSSGRILFDLSVDASYAQYQRSVIGADALERIGAAARGGFKCAATTLGGSMGATSKRVFRELGIADTSIAYFLDAEDSRFHRVGEIGDHNFGADVGKAEVCANTGAPAKLLSREADLVLLWDPDGDRLNIMTTAPVSFRARATEFGLALGPSNDQLTVVYFTPNQLYLLLIDYRIRLLRQAGLLNTYGWFVGTTFPTSMAIEELALQEGLPTVRVPVGFRNLGDLCRTLESKLGHDQVFTTLTGQAVTLGPAPRALILCEESGGAALGGPDLMTSRSGAHRFLALREKDGMQLAILSWSLAASAHASGTTLAEQYCNIISSRNLQYRYGARLDVTLYDESLTGKELAAAKQEGIYRRDRIVEFFRQATGTGSSTGRSQIEVARALAAASHSPAASQLPEIRRAAWVGDGSLFEMQDARLIVRASGTDALIRYYLEATSEGTLQTLREFVGALTL